MKHEKLYTDVEVFHGKSSERKNFQLFKLNYLYTFAHSFSDPIKADLDRFSTKSKTQKLPGYWN